MSLSEIKNKLYRKDFDDKLSQHDKSEFDAKETNISADPKKAASEDVWKKRGNALEENQKKAIKWGAIAVGGILAVVLAVLGMAKFMQGSFDESRVSVSISGPSEADSGKLLAYEISFKNDNRASLKNAVVRVNYPESFKPENNSNFQAEGETAGVFNIGEVAGGTSGKVVFSGKAYSPKGALMYLKAELNYVPSSFNSTFASKNQIGVNIVSSPINLEVLAPQNLASGDSLDYLVSYKNAGQSDFESIRIKIDYPDGFTFSKADPKSSEGDNIWYIGRLSAGQEGRIVVSGKLEGARDDVRNVRAYVGAMNGREFVSYNEEKTATKIAASPLSISQLVNGSNNLTANAGDVLRFQIKYKNESDTGFKDVIVTEKLESQVLDYTTLEMKGGSFDANRSTITWKAADYPNLKLLGPGQEGTIEFAVKVKTVIPVGSVNDKNFVISTVAKVDSPDIPTPIQMNKIIAGNKIDIRLNSKLVLDTRGFYNDYGIPNSGPNPPVVGQETTYTLRWIARNVSNDVSNAKIEAVLPTGITMTGKFLPEDSHLTYNGRNNSIVWDIGNISAGTGVLDAPLEVSFQVRFVPAPNQAGSVPELIGPATFSAKDLFTGKDLSFTAEKKNALIIEDFPAGTDNRVQP